MSKSNLLGVALCRLQASLKGDKCESTNFATINDVLVALVQDLIALSEQMKTCGDSNAKGENVIATATQSGVSIDEKQLHAHVKMELANVEKTLLESKPVKEAFKRLEESLRKSISESTTKADDLSVKLQTGIASLSKDSETVSLKLQSLEERVSAAETEGGSALRADVDRVRKQVKELDNFFSTSLADLRTRTDKGHDTLKGMVAESGNVISDGLLTLREQSYANLTTSKQELSETVATLGEDLAVSMKAQSHLVSELDLVNASLNALSESASTLPTKVHLEHLNASIRQEFNAGHMAISNSVGVVNASIIELSSAFESHVAKTATDLSEVSNNISTAVARGNGILSKVIGEMNATIQGSVAKYKSLVNEVDRLELTGEERYKASALTDKELVAGVARLNESIASFQDETRERAHEHAALLDRRLQAVNTTALDRIEMVEGRLLQGIDEIAKEVSLVEQNTQSALAQHNEETEMHRQAANATVTAALASALESVDREIENMHKSVNVQLTDLVRSVSSLSETSSVAREVLGERITSLNARVNKEEEETTRTIETSAQNREKISKMEGQLSQCEARSKEMVEDASRMRDRITKLETLVEMLMKK